MNIKNIIKNIISIKCFKIIFILFIFNIFILNINNLYALSDAIEYEQNIKNENCKRSLELLRSTINNFHITYLQYIYNTQESENENIIKNNTKLLNNFNTMSGNLLTNLQNSIIICQLSNIYENETMLLIRLRKDYIEFFNSIDNLNNYLNREREEHLNNSNMSTKF